MPAVLFVKVRGRRVEYRMVPGDLSRPTIVFLHEGLGCAALWRDFPDKVAAALGARALVYSRFGYGRSDGLTGPRSARFMHEEGLDELPALLDELEIERPTLVGHSDGASIALICAAASGRHIAGLVLMAPHAFVEPITVESIARIRETYRTTDLRQRLSRYHANVDDAFLGWADTWLRPEFRSWSIEGLLPQVTQSALLIQGTDDEYGTLDQIDRIEAGVRGDTRRLVLDACGHSPHRDQEAAVVKAIAAFENRRT